MEKLSWLLDHPAQAQAIGMAGRSLALSTSYESAVENAASTIRSVMQASQAQETMFFSEEKNMLPSYVAICSF